ncbi:hypothetical protein Pmani_031099 [Petrolisthes manimaculis]|uniref:Uncharacterized protein n=1 Tax=Petrolisthes manimaculis TaxID=1843537 RepID=A0AAE1TSB2_9EUCA|nr:hypothetical protein Pmani_031099 [Petrolisthes manimaculis]
METLTMKYPEDLRVNHVGESCQKGKQKAGHNKGGDGIKKKTKLEWGTESDRECCGGRERGRGWEEWRGRRREEGVGKSGEEEEGVGKSGEEEEGDGKSGEEEEGDGKSGEEEEGVGKGREEEDGVGKSGEKEDGVGKSGEEEEGVAKSAEEEEGVGKSGEKEDVLTLVNYGEGEDNQPLRGK